MATQRKNKKITGKTFVTMASCVILVGVLFVLTISNNALAKKPGSGGPGGDTQDIPVCVTVTDTVAIASVGGPEYCDSKSEHVAAFIGRSAGQFVLDTNTNNADGGRTMDLTFDDPVDRPQADEGPDPLFSIPGSVTPIAVRIITARPQVAEGGGRGYVDLRATEEGVPELIAAKIELIVTNEQYAYILNYRSHAWSEYDTEHFDPVLYNTDFLTVTRTSATTWTLQSGPSAKARLRRRLGWNEIHDIGIFDVPIQLEIELQ